MKKRIVALVVIGILIIASIAIAVMYFFRDNKEDIKENVTLDQIEGYPYTLEDRDNKIYKDEYKNLKEILENEEINYEEYAQSIAKLFIIDLYTLDNKINKYDIGGLDFLLEESKANFILKVEDTLYKYLQDDTYETRDQDLPVVKTIEVTDIKEDVFGIGEVEYPSYVISLVWTYEDGSDYDTEGKITTINKDGKLYVVQKEEVNEQVAS